MFTPRNPLEDALIPNETCTLSRESRVKAGRLVRGRFRSGITLSLSVGDGGGFSFLQGSISSDMVTESRQVGTCDLECNKASPLSAEICSKCARTQHATYGICKCVRVSIHAEPLITRKSPRGMLKCFQDESPHM